MSRDCYITGTDTGIGKTWVSVRMLAGLNAAALRAVGMKPVASGCDRTAAGLRNADALQLIEHSAGYPAYADVNPYAFAEAIAPHLAAAATGEAVDLRALAQAHARLAAGADHVVVEGVGGWLAPLGRKLMQADLVRALDLPVILVVGLRLGCLNHSLLSARAIREDGCELLGWVGNVIDPAMLSLAGNIDTLRERLSTPCLGIVPFGAASVPCSPTQALAAACAALSTRMF